MPPNPPCSTAGPEPACSHGNSRVCITAALLLFAILALGLFIRTWRISEQSAWGDECVSYGVLDSPDVWTFLDREIKRDPPMVPLYFVLQYAWASLFGNNMVVMRLLSILFGVLTILVLYLTGKELKDRCAGLVAGLCLAMALPHVYYSQEMRMYSLTILLAASSTYALLRALNGGGWRWWAGNVAFNMLLLWTHAFSVFFLFAQGCYLLLVVRRIGVRALLGWAVSQAPNAVAVGLWLRGIDSNALEVAAGWRTTIPHGVTVLINGFLCFTGASFVPCGRYVPEFLHWQAVEDGLFLGIPTRFLIALLFLAALIAVVWRALRNPASEEGIGDREKTLLMLSVLLVPPITMHVFSAFFQPCYQDRYVLYASLGWYLIAGVAVSHVSSRKIQAGFVAALLILYANQYAHTETTHWRHDWKGVGKVLKSEGWAGEKVLVIPWFYPFALTINAGIPPGSLPDSVSYAKTRYVTAADLLQTLPNSWMVAVPSQRIVPEALENSFRERNLQYTKFSFGGEFTRVIAYHLRAPGASAH